MEYVGIDLYSTSEMSFKISEEIVQRVDLKYIVTNHNTYRLSNGLEVAFGSSKYMLHLTKEDAERSAHKAKLIRGVKQELAYSKNFNSLSCEELTNLLDLLNKAK